MSLGAALSEKQQRSIVEADARFNLWEGAVRSGKTVSSLIAWLDFLRTAGPGRFAVVAKTKDTAARNVFDSLEDILGRLYQSAVSYTPGANAATILGRRVYVIGATDSRSEGRVRGMTLAGAYVDEGTLLPYGFLPMLMTRLSLPYSRLFMTTNPDNPQHWLKKDYIDKAEAKGLRTWSFTLYDNPGLTPQVIAALEAENQGMWYRRFILGEWVAGEGAVYDAWDADTMVIDVRPPIERLVTTWAGVDYGTSNPLSFVLFGLMDTGQVVALAEYRYSGRDAKRQLTDSEYSRHLRTFIHKVGVQPERVYVDPSAASFKVQLRRDGWQGVRDAKSDVLDGIRTAASAIAQGRLLVHRSCTGLLGELPGYTWDEDKAKRGIDEPVKVDDHSVDAMRYALHSSRSLWYALPQRKAG